MFLKNHDKTTKITLEKHKNGLEIYANDYMNDAEIFALLLFSLREVSKELVRKHKCSINCKLELHALQTIEFINNLIKKDERIKVDNFKNTQRYRKPDDNRSAGKK